MPPAMLVIQKKMCGVGLYVLILRQICPTAQQDHAALDEGKQSVVHSNNLQLSLGFSVCVCNPTIMLQKPFSLRATYFQWSFITVNYVNPVLGKADQFPAFEHNETHIHHVWADIKCPYTDSAPCLALWKCSLGSSLLSNNKPGIDYSFASKLCETRGFESRGNVGISY